ncbi:MAG: hypothetical protein ACOC2G_03110 [Bacillota bacterium]
MDLNYLWILALIYLMIKSVLENINQQQENDKSTTGPQKSESKKNVDLSYKYETGSGNNQQSRTNGSSQERADKADSNDQYATELAAEKDFFQQDTEATETDEQDESKKKRTEKSGQGIVGGEITGARKRKEKKEEEPKAKKVMEKQVANLTRGGISQSDLVRGIVFKEILGAPRSRRPYRQPRDRE